MNLLNVNVLHPSTEKQWADYFRLRYEILRKPWNQPEHTTKDDAEEISIHWLITDQTEHAIATGRLQLNSQEEGQIRSMAVRTDQQGKGLGSLLIAEIEKEARKRNLKRIVLDARENAVSFYLHNGYTIDGKSYLLFGVIPHFRMSKTL